MLCRRWAAISTTDYLGAGVLGDHGNERPDRTAADDHYVVASGQLSTTYVVDRDREGLDEGSVVETQVLRQCRRDGRR